MNYYANRKLDRCMRIDPETTDVLGSMDDWEEISRDEYNLIWSRKKLKFESDLDSLNVADVLKKYDLSDQEHIKLIAVSNGSVIIGEMQSVESSPVGHFDDIDAEYDRFMKLMLMLSNAEMVVLGLADYDRDSGSISRSISSRSTFKF